MLRRCIVSDKDVVYNFEENLILGMNIILITISNSNFDEQIIR